MGEFVIAGDSVTPKNEIEAKQKRKLCGRGIIVTDNQPFASVCGYVHENAEKVWVNHFNRRYFPQTGDKVIGIVTHKIGDSWRVDVAGVEKAEIDFMSFENATKRNRPDIKIGDLLYGQITVINKHLEPQMSCVDNVGKARGMGILPRCGTVIALSCTYSRRLLTDNCPLLPLLGKSYKFETTIGINGRVWINAESYDDIRFLKNAILLCEKIPDSEVPNALVELFNSVNWPKAELIKDGSGAVEIDGELESDLMNDG